MRSKTILRNEGLDFSVYERYFSAIYRETGLSNRGNYVEIARILFNTPFKAVLTLDQNRALETFSMREWLFGDVSVDFSKGVNCLEILWNLALKMSDLSLECDRFMDPREGFWEIFCNLGLQQFEGIGSISEAREVHFLLEKWLERRYDRAGNGGIFPLRRPRRDQKKVEIWYQMQEYLEENCGVKG